MQIVRCKNCGAEVPDWDAIEFNTGRTQYMCMECYKAGCYDVGIHKQRLEKRKEKDRNAKDGR